MKAALFGITALLALGGCTKKPAPDAKAIRVTDAFVRLPVIADRPAAAYFTLNGGKEADRLVAVSSDKAARIELHESKTQDGMMSMRQISSIDVPPGATVRFAEGGNHAMLFGLDPALRPGGTITLSFSFKSGRKLDVAASTIAAGDEAPGKTHKGH